MHAQGSVCALIPEDAPEVVSPADLSRWFGVERVTVIRWARQGRLPPAIQIAPRTYRWRTCDLRAWFARQKGQTP